MGIHTAVESTGFASFSVMEQALPYIDVFLMDIKHMNSEKHEKFTGKPNSLILENAKKIAEWGTELIIRVPVIPTFNHLPREIGEIAQYAKTLPRVKELHLLPYHRLGTDKYKGLKREYLMPHIETPERKYMEKLLQEVENFGISCQIGG